MIGVASSNKVAISQKRRDKLLHNGRGELGEQRQPRGRGSGTRAEDGQGAPRDDSREVRDGEEGVRVEDVGFEESLQQVPRHWVTRASGRRGTERRRRAGGGASFSWRRRELQAAGGSAWLGAGRTRSKVKRLAATAVFFYGGWHGWSDGAARMIDGFWEVPTFEVSKNCPLIA